MTFPPENRVSPAPPPATPASTPRPIPAWLFFPAIGAWFGLAYALLDLLLILWKQPEGMETLSFLIAYTGSTATAAAFGGAGAVCAAGVVAAPFGGARVIAMGLAGALAVMAAYARVSGVGIHGVLLPLWPSSSDEALRRGLLALVVAVLTLGMAVPVRLLRRSAPGAALAAAAILSAPACAAMGAGAFWWGRVHPESTELPLLPIAAGGCSFILLIGLLAGPRRLLWAQLAACGMLGAAVPVCAWIAQRPPHFAAATVSPNPEAPRHILFVVSDTLRRDALSVYNPAAASTPHLDAFAGEAIRFEQAIAPSSWTLPSIASAFTGEWPARHGATNLRPLPRDAETLAERLREAGYLTAAIGMNPMLRGARTGIDQGFDHFDWQPREERRKSALGTRILARLFPHAWPYSADTASLSRLAAAWYRTHAERPTFLWLHYFDPHEDYDPPAAFPPAGTPPDGVSASHFRGALLPIRLGLRADKPEFRAWMRALYDAEVRFVDHEFGQLLAQLRETGIYDKMLIVFLSDHGEEFWEHGGFGHGHTLHNELLAVPLIIKPPGLPAARTIAAPVSLVDVAPTILDFAGIGEATMRERSLALHWRGGEAPEARPFFARTTLYFEPQDAVIHGGWKLIRWNTSRREALYNMAEDPGETRDLLLREPARAEELRALLDAHAGETEAVVGPVPAAMPSASEEALRSLGYIE